MTDPTVFLAADALTDADRGRVPLSGAQWGPSLNAGFSITGTINPRIVERSLVDPYGTVIYVYRGGQLMGGGIVDNLQPSGQQLTVTCIGFEAFPQTQYLEDSIAPAVFADPLDIARSLWTYMQAQPDADLGIVMDDATTKGKVKVGTPSDPFRMDWWDVRSIGDYLSALSGSDDGFDYRVDVDGHADGSRTKRLVQGYPRLGARRHELRFDDSANVIAVPGTNVIYGPTTDVIATGSGTGRTMLRSTSAHRGSGKLRKMSVSAEPNEKNQAKLDARARAVLNARRVAVDVSQLQLRGHPDATLGSFVPGDEIRTSLHANWNDYDGWMRVMGWQFVERNGEQQEQLVVDVARAEQFVYGPDPDIDVSSGGGE